MERQLRRSTRENLGAVPKHFENFVVGLPHRSSMIRTPVKSVVSQGESHQQSNKDAVLSVPTETGTQSTTVPRSRASKGTFYSEKGSGRSRSSKVSRTDSQLKALELEEQIEEEELKASLERDRIIAEQQMAALQIQSDLALKAEQKKADFLKRKYERELQKNELMSGSSHGSSVSSRTSACTSTQRVSKWLSESAKVKPDVEREPLIPVVQPLVPAPAVRNQTPVPETGVNEILSQAFKALQNRNMKDLPSFSGEIMEWTMFENDFNTSTEEFQLTDRDNLRRLNKALQGKARKAVESLLSSPDNVAQIMRMLKSNFGRTEWVVANRLEALRNLESIKEGNIESFRVFYNAVIGTKVAMQNVKADAYLMNPELMSHLAEKLPAFSKQMWVRHKAALMKEDVVIDFNIFARWLEDEMDNQLASLNPVFNSKKPNVAAKPKQMVLHVNSREEEAPPTCPLCSSGSHVSLEKCGQFRKLSVAQRRSAANSCKVCYICLKADHSRKHCKSKGKCSICEKNHHELVHVEDLPLNNSSRQTKTVESEMNVCNVNGRNANTLLRVGKVRIRGPTGVVEVFALFDEGSSLSMMDAAVATRIGLNGPISTVNYRWTNGVSHKEEQSMTLSFEISGPSERARWFTANKVRTVQKIDLPPVRFDVERVKLLYPMLDEEKLAAIQDARPCMLV